MSFAVRIVGGFFLGTCLVASALFAPPSVNAQSEPEECTCGHSVRTCGSGCEALPKNKDISSLTETAVCPENYWGYIEHENAWTCKPPAGGSNLKSKICRIKRDNQCGLCRGGCRTGFKYNFRVWHCSFMDYMQRHRGSLHCVTRDTITLAFGDSIDQREDCADHQVLTLTDRGFVCVSLLNRLLNVCDQGKHLYWAKEGEIHCKEPGGKSHLAVTENRVFEIKQRYPTASVNTCTTVQFVFGVQSTFECYHVLAPLANLCSQGSYLDLSGRTPGCSATPPELPSYPPHAPRDISKVEETSERVCGAARDTCTNGETAVREASTYGTTSCVNGERVASVTHRWNCGNPQDNCTSAGGTVPREPQDCVEEEEGGGGLL